MTSGQVRTVTNSLDASSILRRVSTRWRAPALAAGVIVVAGVCTLVLPITRPQYDPYGWLLWGREITNGSPPFSTVDYPSWKPLAALLTTPIALVAVAALWFGGDAIGSGSAFHGGGLSREAANARTTVRSGSPVLYALGLFAKGPLAILVPAAVAGFVIGLRRRERLILMLGLITLAWLAVDTALAATGYPADVRFVLPADVVASVLGAVGLVRVVREARVVRVRAAAVAAS